MSRRSAAPATDRLVLDCLERLRAVPFVQDAQLAARAKDDPPAIAARLAICAAGRVRKLPCTVQHSHLSRAVAQHLIVLGAGLPGLLVLAPAVGSELGELFEQARINFIDRAGNCYLRVDDKLVARVQGRKVARAAPSGRALRAPAYRALFALLARPSLIDAPVREIAAASGVSPQTAADLKQRLIDRGVVVKIKARHVWLPERHNDALNMFVAGFADSLAPHLLVGRYRAAERDTALFEQRVEPLLDEVVAWRYGGGAAAMRLTGHFRSERTVIYVQDPPADLPARLRLVQDRDGPIVLMRQPGHVAFDSPHPRCVNPLLAYADLLAEHDSRAREAAVELYDRFLASREAAK